jgi:hypothetical protein
VASRLCLKCGTAMAGDWPGEYHVGCYPDFEKMPGFDMTSYDIEVGQDLIDIVLWAQRNATRSKQVALGISEVGNECDLRLAYKMAGMPPTSNSPDPWPSIVGTSIHSWVEQAVNDYQNVHGISEWLTELEVAPSPLVQGHTDLYHSPRHLVLDWKFPSPDNLRKMRQEGPSVQYQVQVQLYGLGHLKAGRKVERVGIASLGRQGWLKDLYVWTTPFDQQMAEEALSRIYRLGAGMVGMGLPQSGRWDQISRSPSRLCSWCPWFNGQEQRPSSSGCPGYKR